MMSTEARHHNTKTYRGRSACAGSGQHNDERGCLVCGRSNVASQGGGGVSTHLHADDLASASRTTTTTTTTDPNKHYKAGAKFMLPLAVAAIERAVPHVVPTVRSIRDAVIEIATSHYFDSIEDAERIADFAVQLFEG